MEAGNIILSFIHQVLPVGRIMIICAISAGRPIPFTLGRVAIHLGEHWHRESSADNERELFFRLGSTNDQEGRPLSKTRPGDR